MKASWYRTWFDSNYYHILYHHRDEEEAKAFLENLVSRLELDKSSRIIDIGCGKGRHAIYLNKLGFSVQGIDLSKRNIELAKSSEKQHLRFDVCDMRNTYKSGYYDCVLNLFTSFGYFDEDEEDLRSLNSMAANLKKNGVFVLDYLNVPKAEKEINENVIIEQTIDNIHFRIEKRINGKFIEKKIRITDKGETHQFVERVKRLRPDDFVTHMNMAGLSVKGMFGDYQLNEFDVAHSDRLIILARKS